MQHTYEEYIKGIGETSAFNNNFFLYNFKLTVNLKLRIDWIW